MKRKLFVIGSCVGLLLTMGSMAPLKAQVDKHSAWTDTTYPAYIKKATDFGERADWSHDGKRILFVERSFGDVYEYDLETGKYRPLTHHYYHGGYVRALYLSNGDILLSGVRDFPGEDWREARFRLAELWVLDKDLDKPPVRLGEYCWEGPAVSRTRPRIAWAVHHGVYPKATRYYQMFTGDIDFSGGEPRIVNQQLVLDNSKGMVKGQVLEPQNFRPGKEYELTVQAYSKEDCEVLGLDLRTGELVNYSNDAKYWEEPEGIFPDGAYTLVETTRETGRNIDIYRMKLDPLDQEWERLTWFGQDGDFKATNPVVSDDGRYIAFQVPGVNDVAGIGHGIYIMDLKQRSSTRPRQAIPGHGEPRLTSDPYTRLK
jgi:Tol biopolymer transport system component